MRKMLQPLLVAAVLCGAAPSFGQTFANRYLGLGVSVVKLLGNSPSLDVFVPISIEGGWYLENGFEFYARPQFFITRVLQGAQQSDGSVGAGIVVGGGGQVGVRYLFLEESIRPYIGLHASLVVLATAPAASFIPGPGVNVGVDFFVADSVSIGLRVPVDLYLQFNTNGQDVIATVGLGGTANVLFYY
mgnify:CR=1 FL=1